MSHEPLSPAEVDALLRPDPRTRCADMLVLRDALSRMAGALEQLADAVQRLHAIADQMEADGGDSPAAPRGSVIPPRAD
ncbi:MAG TPA: hypothetical protein VFS08_09010 [Gemmatimonadaceae bacterium]|nr:hypothetical protein [Gemmatimonadaceae bacterium]